MINPQDMRLQKMMELLEELQFSEKDQEIAERFLEGTCAEDALNELTFMDLTTKQGMEAKSQKVLRDLFTKGRQEDAKRLTLVLFGAGKSSSYRLIPYEWISDVKEKNKLGFPTEMLVSWYSEKIGNNQYWMNKSMYRNLRTFAEHDPQVIKKAMDLHGGGFDNGLLVLYASYFWVKYPDGKEAEKVVLDKEDESLMSRYENEILSSLENMFNKQMKDSDLQLLIDGVKQEQVTPEMKKIASENAANNFLILLLGGAAFMNFRLSGKLKCCVELILAANESAMLEAMDKMDVREDLKEKGGEYDVLFGIPTNRYISWAALKKHTVVLEALFLKDKQLYVEAFEKADFETGALMLEVIEKKDPLLGRQIKANGKSLQQQQLINGMIKKQTPEFNQLASYLKGEAAVESIYPIEGMLTGSYKYSGSQERRILELYAKSYGYDNFYDRCMAAFLFLEASYAYHSMLLEKGVLSEAQLKHLFAALKRAGLNFEHQLKAASLIYETLYADRYKNAALAVYDEIFGGYLREKHSEMLDAFHKADAFGRYLGLYVMKSSAANYQEEILSFSMDSAKLVKEELMEILKMHPEWEAAAVVMLSSKKAQERELAVRALISWDENAHRKLLQEAYEKEKNAKVRALLQSVFGAENAEMKSVLSCDDLVKERHKGGKKKSLAWAYETSFSPVHKINGEEASEEYLQALLLCYASMGTPGVNEDARLLAQNLKEDELVQYVNELFEKWMDAGAEAKKRWVLYAAAIHGGTPIVAKLKKQIQEWPEHARGAIAADAVCALALNPQPQALLIVDSISRKFKFKQVKAAAGKALDFAAAQLNLTREELADRIVPDLGFNENMERTFDYGERKFKVTITPALEIEIFDENEKKLKNMPAPGKKDDPRTAVASYEAFKELKKQMKATVSSQKARLEMALSCARQWKVEDWKNLFVKNPVMHQFAIGLIWGVYESQTLVQSFRYMEDGSFNTEEEDEFELPQNGLIGLVHPVELSEESKEAWTEQLSDYEITQPFEQLKRVVYQKQQAELEEKHLERFGGMIVNDLSLGSRLQGAGWYRGSVQDGGCFYTYYREDAEIGLGAELHFSGSYVAGDNDDVTVYDVRFYRAGTVQRGSYVYDEADDKKAICLKEVPERYFSEIVLQLTKATASSKEKNDGWKEQRGK